MSYWLFAGREASIAVPAAEDLQERDWIVDRVEEWVDAN
jgi:hypothetical protein